MASEEIQLNEALEAAGLEVIETDLGEYIIQLAHETPSHVPPPGGDACVYHFINLWLQRLDALNCSHRSDQSSVISNQSTDH